MRRIFYFNAIFFFVLMCTTVTLADVTVTPASGGTNLARSTSSANGTPGGYASLGNIVILEGAFGDINQSQTNQTLIITAPTNWQFNPSVGTVSTTAGDDITSISIAVVAATITITFSTATGGPGFDSIDEITISGIQIQAIDGSITPSADSLLRTSANPGNGTLTGIVTGTTNFGNLSLDGSSPLPVELTSFSADLTESGILLNWRTVAEVDNYGFEVQRSSKKGKWDVLGFVEGHGNTYSPKEYEFIDDLSAYPDRSQIDSLKYRLKQIDLDGAFEYYSLTAAVDMRIVTDIDDAFLPVKFELYQNYPNPFNPATTIEYSIPVVVNSQESIVNLKIYDVLGKEIATLVNKQQSPGTYSVKWDASSLSSGVYIYSLTAGSYSLTKKMILSK